MGSGGSSSSKEKNQNSHPQNTEVEETSRRSPPVTRVLEPSSPMESRPEGSPNIRGRRQSSTAGVAPSGDNNNSTTTNGSGIAFGGLKCASDSFSMSQQQQRESSVSQFAGLTETDGSARNSTASSNYPTSHLVGGFPLSMSNAPLSNCAGGGGGVVTSTSNSHNTSFDIPAPLSSGTYSKDNSGDFSSGPALSSNRHSTPPSSSKHGTTRNQQLSHNPQQAHQPTGGQPPILMSSPNSLDVDQRAMHVMEIMNLPPPTSSAADNPSAPVVGPPLAPIPPSTPQRSITQESSEEENGGRPRPAGVRRLSSTGTLPGRNETLSNSSSFAGRPSLRELNRDEFVSPVISPTNGRNNNGNQMPLLVNAPSDADDEASDATFTLTGSDRATNPPTSPPAIVPPRGLRLQMMLPSHDETQQHEESHVKSEGQDTPDRTDINRKKRRSSIVPGDELSKASASEKSVGEETESREETIKSLIQLTPEPSERTKMPHQSPSNSPGRKHLDVSGSDISAFSPQPNHSVLQPPEGNSQQNNSNSGSKTISPQTNSGIVDMGKVRRVSSLNCLRAAKSSPGLPSSTPQQQPTASKFLNSIHEVGAAPSPSLVGQNVSLNPPPFLQLSGTNLINPPSYSTTTTTGGGGLVGACSMPTMPVTHLSSMSNLNVSSSSLTSVFQQSTGTTNNGTMFGTSNTGTRTTTLLQRSSSGGGALGIEPKAQQHSSKSSKVKPRAGISLADDVSGCLESQSLSNPDSPASNHQYSNQQQQVVFIGSQDTGNFVSQQQHQFSLDQYESPDVSTTESAASASGTKNHSPKRPAILQKPDSGTLLPSASGNPSNSNQSSVVQAHQESASPLQPFSHAKSAALSSSTEANRFHGGSGAEVCSTTPPSLQSGILNFDVPPVPTTADRHVPASSLVAGEGAQNASSSSSEVIVSVRQRAFMPQYSSVLPPSVPPQSLLVIQKTNSTPSCRTATSSLLNLEVAFVKELQEVWFHDLDLLGSEQEMTMERFRGLSVLGIEEDEPEDPLWWEDSLPTIFREVEDYERVMARVADDDDLFEQSQDRLDRFGPQRDSEQHEESEKEKSLKQLFIKDWLTLYAAEETTLTVSPTPSAKTPNSSSN